MKWIAVMVESHGKERGGQWDEFPQKIHMGEFPHQRKICWIALGTPAAQTTITHHGVVPVSTLFHPETLPSILTHWGKFCTMNQVEDLAVPKATLAFETIPFLE